MDLSGFSTEDLKALQSGDLSKVSTAGLKALQGQAAHSQAEARVMSDPITQGALHPEEGGNTFLAGIGQGMTNTARGVGQLAGKLLPDSWDQKIGLPTQADIDQSKALDKPLMNTTGGKWGGFTGTLAAGAPVMLVPGVNGYAGAAMVGGLTGLAQPVASDEGPWARATNTGVGAAAGPLGVGIARGIGGVWNAGKAMIQPFTQSGQEQIAGRTLARFADDPNLIGTATSKPTITGARPTLAEQTGDAGLARLQDSLRSLDPQIENMIGGRIRDNNAARVGALESLAGDSGKRATAEAERSAAAKPLYDSATKQSVPVDAELLALMNRPSVQSALGRASKIAQEQGRAFGLSQGSPGKPGLQILGPDGSVLSDLSKPGAPASISGQTLQDLKMGMDALLKDPTSGIAGKEAAAVGDTRNAIVQWMEKNVPDFKAARTTYAAKSQPLNAMDVGEVLARKGLSNTSDLAGNPRLMANGLLGTLRDEPKLIQQAIGKKGVSSLSQVFTPEQQNLLGAIAKEADRSAAVATAGNGPGSATAQRMASQNIIGNLMGPLGSMGDKAAQSTFAQTILGKPIQWVYDKVAEPKIQQALARAVLDPDAARGVLAAAKNSKIELPGPLRARLTQQAAGLSTSESAREVAGSTQR